VRARAGRERARLRLVERAARRRVSRGRLRDVEVLGRRHGEDIHGGGRVHLAHPRLGLRGDVVHLALAKHPHLGLRGGDRVHLALGLRLDAQPVVLMLEVLRVVLVLRAQPLLRLEEVHGPGAQILVVLDAGGSAERDV